MSDDRVARLRAATTTLLAALEPVRCIDEDNEMVTIDEEVLAVRAALDRFDFP